MLKSFICLSLLILISPLNLFGQEALTLKNHDVHNNNAITFKILQPFTPFVIDDALKGKSLYHYFVYTVENSNGLTVPPENLLPGDVLADDVFTATGVLTEKEYVETPDGDVKVEEVKADENILQARRDLKEARKLPLSISGIRENVRLFVKGHTLDEKDIRILKRVPFKVLIAGNQRYNVTSMKLNTELPLDVVDFQGNKVLEKGIKLDPRNLAILRQLPISPINVKRPCVLNLDVKVFQGNQKTMTCLPGCDEEYDVSNAYSGIKFKCGDAPDSIMKLGIKRITKKSYYTGEDGIIGCGNTLTTPQAEYSPLHNHIAIDKIWDSEPKTCQFCMTKFQVKNIQHFHKAKLKNPTSNEFFEEKIQRFSPDSKVALGKDTFALRDIKEYIPEEIECPGCGKWLRQDLNFLDLNIHPLQTIEKDKDFYANIQTIPFGHTRRGIAVFSDISKYMDKMQIVVGGLDENIYEQIGDSFSPIAPKNLAKILPDNRFSRRLVIKYERRGDEFNTPRDDILNYNEEWQYFRQDIFNNRVASEPVAEPVKK
jgi:hypothetical protein